MAWFRASGQFDDADSFLDRTESALLRIETVRYKGRRGDMRTIIAAAFMTLDGVVQDPGSFGETEHGGWAQRYFGDEAREQATKQVLASDLFLLGRRTYEMIERAWSGNTGPYAEALNRIPKVVVTSTLHGPLPWNATALNGDAAQAVAGLDGTILIYGSFTLMRTLLQHKLIDQFHITVHPLFLGSGRRLFDGAAPGELRLVGATPQPSGVVTLSYAP
jgi:dihydrofolate reductase